MQPTSTSQKPLTSDQTRSKTISIAFLRILHTSRPDFQDIETKKGLLVALFTSHDQIFKPANRLTPTDNQLEG